MTGCSSCGCYQRGTQEAAFETYAFNILYSQTRETATDFASPRPLVELDAAMTHHARWADWPDGDDHLIRGED